MSSTTLIHVLGVQGRAVPVPGNNIDTDVIIPARYLKEITFEPLGQYAFQDERYSQDGTQRSHPFNEPQYQGARILFANKNFGCGSSREHAPQALMRWGINAIVAEGYASIFEGNCRTLGIPATIVSEEDIAKLMGIARSNPEVNYNVNLLERKIEYALDGQSRSVPFTMPETSRTALMEGTWDPTRMLLSGRDAILQKAEELPYANGFREF